jgi:hypothetical protein
MSGIVQYTLAGLGFTEKHTAAWKGEYPTTIMVNCRGPFDEDDRATVYAMVREEQPHMQVVRGRQFAFTFDVTYGVRVDIYPPYS